MFEYAGFVKRNPLYALKNWRNQSKVRKAILDYRRLNNNCEWCGRTNRLQVHHIIPVSVDPLAAAAPLNFTLLCIPDHLRIGHNGDYRRRYEGNIFDLYDRRSVMLIK